MARGWRGSPTVVHSDPSPSRVHPGGSTSRRDAVRRSTCTRGPGTEEGFPPMVGVLESLCHPLRVTHASKGLLPRHLWVPSLQRPICDTSKGGTAEDHGRTGT